MEKINMSIGEVLKERRIELSIKQEDLAEQVEVTVQTVSKWERGITEPKATQVAKLANVLKLSEREICQGSRNSTSQMEIVDFIGEVDSAMHAIPKTQFLIELYNHLDNQHEFVNNIRDLAEKPSLEEQMIAHAKSWLEKADKGSITFENDEERDLFYSHFEKML
ncbi:helix-turn-helix domain-containing protein [Vibrio astriarenae]